MDTSSDGDAVESRPPRSDLRLVLVAVSIAQLLIVIDFFALNLAIPPMADELGVAPSDLQWVMTAYMLAVGSLMVTGGRMGDVLGRKRILLVGLVLFAGASLLCGAAPSSSVVIAGRAFQGIGAALVFPVSIAVVTNAFPVDRRQRAIGIVYAVSALGTALGPLIGGVVSELLSWRWVFFLNVPITLVVIALVVPSVVESRDESASRSIDWLGIALVTSGLVVFTFAVDRASIWGVSSPGTLGTFAAGIGLIVVFALVEAKKHNPLIQLTLFRNRPFVVVMLSATVANSAYCSTIFLSTLYLQQVRGLNSAEAAYVFIALSVGAAISGQLSGRLEKVLPQWVMAASLGVGGLAVLLLRSSEAWPVYLFAFFGVGLGLGLGWAYGSVGTQAVVQVARAGEASGVALTVMVSLAGVAIAAGSTAAEALSPTGAPTADAIDTTLLVIGLITVVAAILTPLLGRVSRESLDALAESSA